LFGLVDIILIIPFSRKLKENDKELNNCQDPWAPWQKILMVENIGKYE